MTLSTGAIKVHEDRVPHIVIFNLYLWLFTTIFAKMRGVVENLWSAMMFFII